MSFLVGTKVQTNQQYFNLFGRKVVGEVVEHPEIPPSDHVTLVRWKYQEGNEIPEHLNNIVAMMARDLEIYNEINSKKVEAVSMYSNLTQEEMVEMVRTLGATANISVIEQSEEK